MCVCARTHAHACVCARETRDREKEVGERERERVGERWREGERDVETNIDTPSKQRNERINGFNAILLCQRETRDDVAMET